MTPTRVSAAFAAFHACTAPALRAYTPRTYLTYEAAERACQRELCEAIGKAC